jgi:alpha-beta hydrolase superfamily lysophospholipase
MDASSLRTADGLQLHLQHWPARRPARGTVFIVHGLGEHIGRYTALASRLNGWGWNAVGHDQRGHGRSAGERGALPFRDALLHDLSHAVDAVLATLPRPLVLLGHSMGGSVAAQFIAGSLKLPAVRPAWSRPVDGLVLSSPALDAGLNAAQKLQLALAAKLTPNRSMRNRLQPEWISRDPAVVEAYKADPLVHDRITPRLASFIVEGGAAVIERAFAWRTPTLLMWAGADRCVAAAGSRDFAVAAPRVLVQTQDFGPLFHEIFNEPEKEEVYAQLGRWLALRAG